MKRYLIFGAVGPLIGGFLLLFVTTWTSGYWADTNLAEVKKLFVVFGKTLQFAYLFGIVPALMMAAVDDILLHVRRIGPVVRMLIVGVIALVVTLIGWLFDARREYVKTVEADQTGHLENPPAPRTPSVLLAVLAILFVGGVALQAGWLPPGQASGGDSPSASPGASGEPGPSGGAGPSDGAPPPPAADVTITASQIAFVETSFTAPADTAFTIALDNQDDGIDHNVELKDGAGTSVFQGELFPGVATEVYEVPALPAGDYTFVCTLHANMTGTATLQ